MGAQTLEGNYKEMALLRQRKVWKHQSTVNSQNTEDDLKILLRILSNSKEPCGPLYISWSGDICLEWDCHNLEKYALQWIVVLFGELLIQLDEAGLTHTYCDVLRCCELRISTTWCWGMWILELDHTRSGQRVVARRGKFIFLYKGDGLWRRFDLAHCCNNGRRVDSWDKMRTKRENW